MVVKFADIAKGPSDLLGDDYSTKTTLKCKKSAGPLAVTIETDRSGTGALTSKVGTKFAYAGLSFDKVQLKPDGSNVLETSIKPYPGLSTTFKGGKGADLGFDYAAGPLRLTGSFDVKDLSRVSTSACLSAGNGILVGGDAVYSATAKGLSAFNVGASYATGPLFACVTTVDKISSVKVDLSYAVNSHLTVASTSSHNSASSLPVFTVGGKYTAGFGDVKAKFASDGSISACVIKEVAPKVTITGSATAPSADMSKLKYGIGIVM
jgi:voltage-dependent anion channel protein 2